MPGYETVLKPVGVISLMMVGVVCSSMVYTVHSEWRWLHSSMLMLEFGVIVRCVWLVCNGAKAPEWSETCGMKQCDKCGLSREQRTHHCTACASCTVRYDHHCKVLGSCVGGPNYKAFFLFIAYTFVFVLHFLCTVALYALPGGRGSNPPPLTLPRFFFGIFTVAIAFVASIFLIYLMDTLTHCLGTMSRNRTTHEDKYRTPEIFDTGNITKNIKVFLGGSTAKWFIP
eukprot:TRINITY_DN26812_c0_g1_i1.p1 TRINITY_DN26812_c0_g1~~TRINITY_DN26812_c0_g1_i1.p1  ORF type:complete len:237 (+),score=18.83 TRINITY_DN26812_c0_g1_i1:29-712(+)